MKAQDPRPLAFECFGAQIGRSWYAEDFQNDGDLDKAFGHAQVQQLSIYNRLAKTSVAIYQRSDKTSKHLNVFPVLQVDTKTRLYEFFERSFTSLYCQFPGNCLTSTGNT